MGVSKHMGASKHTEGASKHMAASEHTGGIQFAQKKYFLKSERRSDFKYIDILV